MVDLFDNYLVATCTIYSKGVGAADALGVEDQTLTSVATAVACRLSTMGSGREFKSDKKATVVNQKVFMRPRALTEHQVLDISGTKYNILSVLRLRDGAGTEHHLEAFVEEVKP